MEEKLKRECKSYLEKLFKKQDDLGSGAVSMNSMKKIIREMIPEYNDGKNEEELSEMMKKFGKTTKYTVMNKATNKIEFKYQEDSIDFPSALYICVYFLKKIEVRSVDCFSGRNVVKFEDLAGMNCNPVEQKDNGPHNRRYF